MYEEAGKNIDLQTGETASTIAESLFKAMRNKVKLDSKARRDRKEDIRSTADFYFALENAGFEKTKSKGRKFIKGLRVKTDDGDFEDFLT